MKHNRCAPYLTLLIALMVSMTLLPVITTEAQTSLPSAGCENQITVESGLSEGLIETEDGNRSYLMYVPEGYDPASPNPLILSFHGFASSAMQQVVLTGWNGLADKYGFIVVYPQGSNFPARWNSGATSNNFAQADDVAFVTALLDEVSSDKCIDASQIYANGMSNGGGMTNRLACDLSDRIAAFGGVAGAYNQVDSCNPERGIPFIAFHGTADTIVPYDGSDDDFLPFPSIDDWAKEWATHNECNLQPTDLPPVGEVTGIRYSDCVADADVILYTVAEGGHTWPGSSPRLELIPGLSRLLGKTTQDINASEVMWQFFQNHPMPDTN